MIVGQRLAILGDGQAWCTVSVLLMETLGGADASLLRNCKVFQESWMALSEETSKNFMPGTCSAILASGSTKVFMKISSMPLKKDSSFLR